MPFPTSVKSEKVEVKSGEYRVRKKERIFHFYLSLASHFLLLFSVGL
jgi:hypothetical protein